jgi:hypothetical protein
MDIHDIRKAGDLPVGSFVIVDDYLVQVIKHTPTRVYVGPPLGTLPSYGVMRFGCHLLGRHGEQYIDREVALLGCGGAPSFFPLAVTTREAALARFERICNEVARPNCKTISEMLNHIDTRKATAREIALNLAMSCVGGDP